MARTLEQAGSLDGKCVFLRTCYDLPIDVSKGLLDPARITDDSRIRDSVPTIAKLVSGGARIILEPGWMGRPKGEDAELSMGCAALRLQKILDEEGVKAKVLLAPNCLDGSKPRSAYLNKAEVEAAAKSLKLGEILMLQNSRYDSEENANDEQFGAFLAGLAGSGALYVNEAEAQNHRPCASVVVTPVKVAQAGGDAALGLHYAKAVKYIGGIASALSSPGRGKFVFFLSGKKIETQPGITSKITVASGLLDKMKAGDCVVVQGAVVYTFLLAQDKYDAISNNRPAIDGIIAGYNSKIKDAAVAAKKSGAPDAAKATEDAATALNKQKSGEILALIGLDEAAAKALVGSSYVDYKQLGEQVAFAHGLLAKAKEKRVTVITGIDHAITDKLPNKSGDLPADAAIKPFPTATGIPQGWLGVAPGSATTAKIAAEVESAAIVLIAGPVSIEDPRIEKQFSPHGRIFAAMAAAKRKGATTVAAGGDTAAFVKELGAQDAFSIVSNAGGATLELIEKGTSPGLQAVEKANGIAAARK